MIRQYHRPQKLQEALGLIARASPLTVPLGGGTFINSPMYQESQTLDIDVVDLQALGLCKIHKRERVLEIGATTTLQALSESAYVSPALRTSLLLEAPLNIRNLATMAGTLVVGDGRSPLVTALLAMDGSLVILPGDERHDLGNFLLRRAEILPGRLITRISLPLNIRFAFEYVSRTPRDTPIVCAALVRWPSGRTRLTLGGCGRTPLLAMDGNDASGLEAAARNVFEEADDEWASAEYRKEVAGVLAKRCLDMVG